MLKIFRRSDSVASRKEERFEGEGVFLKIDQTRYAVPDLSLGGLVFEGAGGSIAKGTTIRADLILPMAIGERQIPVTLLSVRVNGNTTACSVIDPKYEVLMSIRQFILRKRKERVSDSKS